MPGRDIPRHTFITKPSASSIEAVRDMSPVNRSQLLEQYGHTALQHMSKDLGIIDGTVLFGADIEQKKIPGEVGRILGASGLKLVEEPGAALESSPDKPLKPVNTLMIVGMVMPGEDAVRPWAKAHSEFAIPGTDQTPEELTPMLDSGDYALAVVSANATLFLARSLDRLRNDVALQRRAQYEDILSVTTTPNNAAGHGSRFKRDVPRRPLY